MEEPTDYASFLVRLWRRRAPGPAEDAAGWQGEVEHIQSSQQWTFGTLAELLSVLRRQAGATERANSKDKSDKKGGQDDFGTSRLPGQMG